MYFLAKFPEHAEKVYNEVAGLDTHDPAALNDLPHLNAVIQETLRLWPPIPTGIDRETPPEGIMVGERHIPGKVNIVMPRFVIGRRKEYFKQPESFIPERWYSDPDMVLNQKAHIPFNTGKQACLGKDLAMMDIRFVIASIVQKWIFYPDPTKDLERVVRDMRDQFIACPGPLHLRFKSRRE